MENNRRKTETVCWILGAWFKIIDLMKRDELEYLLISDDNNENNSEEYFKNEKKRIDLLKRRKWRLKESWIDKVSRIKLNK